MARIPPKARGKVARKVAIVTGAGSGIGEAVARRPFGKSGESCSALAMGGGFVNFAGFDRSVETVRRAFDLGIRYFDTSVLYQSGASQAILGEALAGRAGNHFLATKVGYFKEARHFRSVEALHVQELQKESGLPMTELVLRFVAADENLSSVLVGACHPAEIEQNVATFGRGKLPADLHAAVEAIARQFD